MLLVVAGPVESGPPSIESQTELEVEGVNLNRLIVPWYEGNSLNAISLTQMLVDTAPLTAWNALLELAVKQDPVEGPITAHTLTRILEEVEVQERRGIAAALQGVNQIMTFPPLARGVMAAKFFGERVWYTPGGDPVELMGCLTTLAHLAAIGWAASLAELPAPHQEPHFHSPQCGLARAARKVLAPLDPPGVEHQESATADAPPARASDVTPTTDGERDGAELATAGVKATVAA